MRILRGILIEIPDEDLEQHCIFIKEDGRLKLDPKYILGFVPLEENHHISRIITKEKLAKDNNYPDTSYDYTVDQTYENSISRK